MIFVFTIGPNVFTRPADVLLVGQKVFGASEVSDPRDITVNVHKTKAGEVGVYIKVFFINILSK